MFFFNLFLHCLKILKYIFFLIGILLVLYIMIKLHSDYLNENKVLLLETYKDSRKMISLDEYVKWQRLMHSFESACENLKIKNSAAYDQLEEMMDALLVLLQHFSFYDNNVISEMQRERFKFLLSIFIEKVELYTVDHPTIHNRLELLGSIPDLVDEATDIYHKMKKYKYN